MSKKKQPKSKADPKPKEVEEVIEDIISREEDIIGVMGRPRTFKTAEELKDAINDYFNNGVKVRIVIVGKAPNQQAIPIPVPTITGLAHYIGFESRQSFYEYGNHKDFTYTIKRSRLFIEKEYEEQLQHGNTTGAIFALKNMGWIDKTQVESKHEIVSGSVEIKSKGEKPEIKE